MEEAPTRQNTFPNRRNLKMSKVLAKQSSVSLLRTLPVVQIAVVVDANIATTFLSACEVGDIDACHLSLQGIYTKYPESVPSMGNESPTRCSRGRVYQRVYELVGHGFTIAATRGHAGMVEFLLSGLYAEALRDGICTDPDLFPPFPALHKFELAQCVNSIRYVCYAALACIDQLGMAGISVLVETRSLWDFEASLCLSMAMRRALDAAAADSTSASPAAFHPIIVLLTRHYDFLVDNIRQFHESFRPQENEDVEDDRRFDRIKALQASLMYEIVLSSID